ncbi:hypothetical protein CYMTET_30339 [Cymbomonas tetramitiformis]|uniref:Dynein heavy chain AAA 5 extension domain-containing protein n=1 Tax=Cymbomonas tetramitiformis TaxID=36881 RepID=A0AAE0KUB0_9CHLO|nr:hypothetical protein CYMTET_30339 [Cymbomonas tetramitiformis]
MKRVATQSRPETVHEESKLGGEAMSTGEAAMRKAFAEIFDTDMNVSDEQLIRRAFLFAVVWSVGGSLPPHRHQFINSWVVEHIDGHDEHCQEMKKAVPPLSIEYPSMFDMTLDLRTRCWVPWSHGLPPAVQLSQQEDLVSLSEDSSFRDCGGLSAESSGISVASSGFLQYSQTWGALGDGEQVVTKTFGEHYAKMAEQTSRTRSFTVPTAHALARTTIAHLLLEVSGQCMLFGPTGSGKTTSIRQLLMDKQDTHVTMEVAMAMGTKASGLQTAIWSMLERRKKNAYGAPKAKPLVVFVDDLSTPSHEQTGMSLVGEQLRQFLEHHGCFPLDQVVFNRVRPCPSAPGWSWL